MADHDTHDHTGVPGVGAPAEILDIPTAETDDTLRLAPDGAGGVEWAASGGGGLAHSFIGYDTIGGTWAAAGHQFCKQITLASDSLIASIDVYVRGNGDAIANAYASVVTDNAGSPHHLLAGTGNGGYYLSNSASMPTAEGWLSFGIGAWLAAGTYWITAFVPAGWDFAYDGSGSDKYFNPSGGAVITGAYPGAWAITTTSNKYSMRASILS